MKKQIKLLSALFIFVAMCGSMHAQRQIKGNVQDSKTKEGLPGATILVPKTTIGVASDENGNFTISVPDTAKFLVVSSLGFTTKVVAITGDNLNITVDPDGILLKETVVTAVGMSREKKSLGYATQEIGGDQVKDSRESNVINSLSGRVAGLNITSSSGGVGASSQIILRGQNSFTGNNAPLFVINGVPVDNSPRNDSRSGSPNYGNPIADINPDDIASVSILKGPVAAALYGSRAQNGAILVTTKNGSGQKGKTGGLQVSLNMGVSMDKVLRLPKFQDKFGQGYWGDDPAKNADYQSADESWGAPLDGRPYVDYRGNKNTWDAQPGNVAKFFKTGTQVDNSLSISSSDEKGSVRFSASGFNQKGTVPNTAYNRYTAGININRQLTDKLSIEAGVTYNLTQGKNRPGTGYGTMTNPLEGLFAWWGRQVNLDEMKEKYNEIDPATGLHKSWNFYHNDVYWVLNNNTSQDRRDRILSTAKISYKITPWLTASVRGGSDYYVENRKQLFKVGTITDAIFQQGGFYNDDVKKNTNNIDAVLVANKNLGKNFSISATAGYNYFGVKTISTNQEVRGLSVPDYYNLSNATNAPILSNSLAKKEIVGIYGLVSLGYKGLLYVDVTARNDVSSTLPMGKNSYFYPSVSGSFVFTELMKPSKFLSFGKIRAGLAYTGNDTDPYNLATTFLKSEVGSTPAVTSNPFHGVNYVTYNNSMKNAALLPEKGRSFEFGTELRFLNNRIALDATYYNTVTSNLIVNATIAPSSGFSSQVLNAGKLQNQGIELMLKLAVVQKTDGFNWDVMVNFSKNKQKILDIADGLDKIELYRDWAYLYLEKGAAYGSLFANGTNSALKDEKGNLLITPSGDIATSPTQTYLGNVQPEFRMGLDNKFSYKGVYFGFLIDWKNGGKVFSQTNMWMDYTGTSDRTQDRPTDGLVIPGMAATKVNGVWTSSGVPNDVKVDPSTYWHDMSYNNFANYVYDATFVKLREITLGYRLPSKMLEKTPFSAISLGLYARNVLILYSKLPYMDPEVNSANSANALGFETAAVPTTRSLGVNLKLTF